MADEVRQPDSETYEGYAPGSDSDIHVTSILFIGIIGAVLTLVIVLVLKALYFTTLQAEEVKKQGTGLDLALSDLRSGQLSQINSYKWVNPQAGTLAIPISQAMQIVVAEQSTHPNNGIEITDWDHNPSDQHPTPGDLVLLGQDHFSMRPLAWLHNLFAPSASAVENQGEAPPVHIVVTPPAGASAGNAQGEGTATANGGQP